MSKSFCELILTENVAVNIVPVPKAYTTARDQARQVIDETWETAMFIGNSGYTNAKIFNILELKFSFEKGFEMEGFFVQYKDFFCQRIKGDIGLGIKPLGVSGIVNFSSSDGKNLVLFGKRAKNLTQYPEHFEMVPSGGVDDKYIDRNGKIEFKENLIVEFEEELDINRSHIKSINVVGVLIDFNDQVYDILLKITTDLIPFDFMPTREYSEFLYITDDHLSEFIGKNEVVPTSIAVSKAHYLYQ